MKRLLLITLSLFIFNIGFSQNRILNWATQMGGVGADQGYSIELDVIGNIYSVGIFEDTVDFDPSSGVHNLISNGEKDFFIQKLDQNGAFHWAVSLGGTRFDEVRDISIDLNGNVLVTGFFQDTVDFDPSSGIANSISKGARDVFILKLDQNGNFIWVKSFGGIADDRAYSIDHDQNGNVIVSGRFSDTVDFDPDTTVFNLISNGFQDIFILKMDSNSNFLWATSMGSYVSDEVRSLIIDSHGNIYATGFVGPGCDFDPDSGVVNVPFGGSFDVYLLKLSPVGKFLWVKGIISSYRERAFYITTDSDENVYTTGYFNWTVDFNPDSAGVFNMNSAGAEDVFIQKLDSSGNFLWAKSIGSAGDDQGFALAIDDSNNVYTSGYFEGTVNFNSDSAGVYNLTSNGAQDIFIQKMDANGNFIWAESFGGTGFDQTRSIMVDQKGSIYATGFFEATVDFDPDTLNSFNLSSIGGNDIFILKLNQCFNSFDTIVTSSCTSYTSPSGKLWTQSGIYIDTIQNTTGCDSLLTIDLTVTIIDTSLTLVNHVKITANDTLSSYQWIECTTGPIAGDTNRSFVATANGTYAVELTNNGCIDTSACVTILSVGLDKSKSHTSTLDFSPNPNQGIFTISVSSDLLAKTYQIFDLKGSLIQEAQFSSNRTSVDLSAFGKGVYFLHIREEGIRKKVVVY